MSIIFYLTFIYLIYLITYYFIYLEHLTYDNLFTIILNFIFLIAIPLYYNYFKENIYSLVFGIALVISSFYLNLQVKKIFQITKIPFIIYFLITSFILGTIIGTF